MTGGNGSQTCRKYKSKLTLYGSVFIMPTAVSCKLRCELNFITKSHGLINSKHSKDKQVFKILNFITGVMAVMPFRNK